MTRHEALLDLLRRLEDVHPDDLPSSLRGLRALWLASGGRWHDVSALEQERDELRATAASAVARVARVEMQRDAALARVAELEAQRCEACLTCAGRGRVRDAGADTFCPDCGPTQDPRALPGTRMV